MSTIHGKAHKIAKFFAILCAFPWIEDIKKSIVKKYHTTVKTTVHIAAKFITILEKNKIFSGKVSNYLCVFEVPGLIIFITHSC